MARTAPCPICKKPAAIGAEASPFCGPRCRLLDLGNWLAGQYVIADDPGSEANTLDGMNGEQE